MKKNKKEKLKILITVIFAILILFIAIFTIYYPSKNKVISNQNEQKNIFLNNNEKINLISNDNKQSQSSNITESINSTSIINNEKAKKPLIDEVQKQKIQEIIDLLKQIQERNKLKENTVNPSNISRKKDSTKNDKQPPTNSESITIPISTINDEIINKTDKKEVESSSSNKVKDVRKDYKHWKEIKNIYNYGIKLQENIENNNIFAKLNEDLTYSLEELLEYSVKLYNAIKKEKQNLVEIKRKEMKIIQIIQNLFKIFKEINGNEIYKETTEIIR